jgi:hypothetical protein
MATMNTGMGGPEGYGTNSFSAEQAANNLAAGNLDDGSYLLDITGAFGAGGLDFFGTSYTGIYINSNGLITFDSPETAYTPVGITGYTSPAIAPFWSDVDLNKGGEIYWNVDAVTGTVTITWSDVAPYTGTGTNSFQMVITDTGGGDFSVEFIYEDIQWTDGFTGDATVGFTDGGTNDTLVEGSGDPAELINYPSAYLENGDPNGTWEMDVTSGTIVESNGSVDGTAGDDLIDAAYAADPENDFVDNNDGTAGVNQNEDLIFAGDGNDTIYAGDENDDIYGGIGDDFFFGGTGADTMRGEAGDDEFEVAEGDVVFGGDGDDTFLIADFGEAGASVITIEGGEGAETTGDTLDFQGLIDFGSITYTNTNPGVGGGLSGTATLADGTIVNFDEIENVIVCFTEGTRISTPYGQRPIETLAIGDLVLTKDNGPRPIRWIGKRTVPAIGKLAPIRFKAGIFDNDRDLLVSPQHRMLCNDWRSSLMFGDSEVLATAKHLINGDTVIQETGGEVTYIHIMFDEHEIVFAENTASESFYPGDCALNAIGGEAREELFSIFPEIRGMTTSYGDTARQCLRHYEAKLLHAA